VLAVGTPGYIAPEQLQGNAADAQGDIFGFGVAFHEMLVGRKPVDREQSRPNVVTAIRSAAPVHSRFSKEFERILERILRGCLQNDPRERYRSAEELVGDLGLAIVKFKIESRPRHDFWPGRKVLRRESAERVRFDGVPEEKVASDHEAELAAWSQMLEIPVQGASEQRQKVESAGDSNPYPTAPPNETASRRLSPARRLAGFAPIGTWALIALAGILSGVYAIHSAKQIPGHKPRSLNVEPLTSYPGNEIQPSLSPSGNQVAFAFRDDRSSNYHICVKPTDAEEPTCLTSASADDLSPSWSPDGKRIVFLRFVSNQIAFLTVIPSVGGREREVAKILVDRSLREIRAAWSPDGEWIATSEAQTPVSPMRLVLISANTGERRRLVYQPPTVRGDLSPSFSPDGRYLVFARHISPAVADIYILGLPKSGQSSSEARRLTNWNRLTRNPLWAGNGREIFFVGEQPGLGPRIWRVPAFQAESARLLDHFGEDSSSIALCPRGNRLVYAKQAEEASIWRIDLSKAGQERAFRGSARLSRLIASTRGAVNPQYSPDGKYIAFQSERSGYTEIWLANSDGSASRQLTQLKAAISGYPRWSPDGKHIIFHSRPSGYANISVLDVETREYRELTTGTTNDSAPSWSHDRKWIYFGSTRQDGSQIWKMPASGGPATRLTKSGGAVALESGDGKLLFFSKHYAAGLWVLPVEGGTESQILPSLYGIDTFAVTKRGIYFVDRTLGGEASLNFISLLSRATQKIVSMKSQVGMGLTVSPDEKSVLYSQIDYAGSDLILVDNFK
jgi:Tol biopolymer transport system component